MDQESFRVEKGSDLRSNQRTRWTACNVMLEDRKTPNSELMMAFIETSISWLATLFSLSDVVSVVNYFNNLFQLADIEILNLGYFRINLVVYP